MTTRQLLTRDMTLYAHLRAYGVNPFFLYTSFVKKLPTPLPFPTVEDLLGEISDALLEAKMYEERDKQHEAELFIRADWIMSNGMFDLDKEKVEITEFQVMEMMKDLRLPYTIDHKKKVFGLVPQREVW